VWTTLDRFDHLDETIERGQLETAPARAPGQDSMLVRPGQLGRDVCSPGSGGNHRQHVRAHRIPHHQKALGIDSMAAQNRGVHRRRFFADDFDEAELIA
jgi:hypothetical protein